MPGMPGALMIVFTINSYFVSFSTFSDEGIQPPDIQSQHNMNSSECIPGVPTHSHVNKKPVLERADDYKTGLIQVKLNNSTEYSCLYAHDGIWVALNVFQVPRRVCPKYVDWPAKDSTKIFDMTQTGTNLNAGASLKLNKGSSNSNVCAYSVLYSEADLLIPKGSGAVCPQKYGF